MKFATIAVADNDGTAVKAIVAWDGSEAGKVEARRMAFRQAHQMCPAFYPVCVTWEVWG